jgi:hypothetical protein
MALAVTRPPPSDRATLDVVRPEVRQLLLRSRAFEKLPVAEQQQIANQMVKVAAYLADPDGVISDVHKSKAPAVARAQADDPVNATKAQLSKNPGQVEFEAQAVRQGIEQFGALVQKVDFPKFVGGLIQNVFQAIVDTSIQQMRAYGELLANVAKTVDQFAQDNISTNNARDWLAGKYPDALDVSIGGTSGEFEEGAEAPAAVQLTAKGENPEQRLAEISKDLGFEKPVTDISDPNEETRLVLGARLEMARGRQQLLASMVILGINRIVVTDGHIQAKVIFDVRAEDEAKREYKASMFDRAQQSTAVKMSAGYGGWFSPVSASMSTSASTDHVATVQSAVDDTSESKAEVKAKLTGEVKVNFKSDYFPMEKMASPQMIAAIQGRSVPPEKPVSGA